LDFGDRFRGYRCRKGHLITVMDSNEIVSVKNPFQNLKACPECGRKLKVISTVDLEVEDGIERDVTYFCEMGHLVPHRQLIQRIFRPKKMVVR
jgi:hypothetical protein